VSDIIDFIERMGADAQLRGASAGELEEALEQAGLDAASWTSMMGMTQSQLESVLGARSNVCSLVYSPQKEEEEEEPEEEGEEEEKEEKQEEKVKSQISVRRIA
jgi:hypothetical protein